ncbi:hypothetical protein [Botrimarina hoheduenensis]|uniref:hypothetical protein n=1 Tax=Botrimarina hoheduenensis TaxID=2528000 RepID=UPI0011B39C11|nr:hypothetical protein [Botrimarina hoheduenensis]
MPDDGRILWRRPTPEAPPIDSRLVPENSELVVLARPAKLLADTEGAKAWTAAGALGQHAMSAIARAAAGRPAEVGRVVVGVASGPSYGQFKTTLIVEPQASATPPLLPSAFDRLLATSSADSQLSVLVSLPWLLGEGAALFEAQATPALETLRQEIDEEWRCALLSVQLVGVDGPLYWEVRLVGGAGVPERLRGKGLAERASKWADELEQTLSVQPVTPHSAKLLSAAPAMLRAAGRLARVGADDGQTVINGYLPRNALHNLVLVAELLVAEHLETSPSTTPEPASTLTLQQRLDRPISLQLNRESLVTAVTILAETIGVPITINGRDLQLQGITRNQMVSLDARQQTAAETLVEVLRRANPDREAAGASDPRQQLVYVIRDSPPAIILTTRAAARERGEPLPAVFIE